MARRRRPASAAPSDVRSVGSSAFIVDLPSDDSEAPIARVKFENVVEGLRRVYPMISEARATVKVSSPMGERKRFEVHALIKLPGRKFDFTAEGWSLAETFDKISNKLKRLRTKPDKKQSYRRHLTRSEIAVRSV